jgi:hypothetical protein
MGPIFRERVILQLLITIYSYILEYMQDRAEEVQIYFGSSHEVNMSSTKLLLLTDAIAIGT